MFGKVSFFTGEIVITLKKADKFFYGISFFDLSEDEAMAIGQNYLGIERMEVDVFLNPEEARLDQSSKKSTITAEEHNLQNLQLELAHTVSMATHLQGVVEAMQNGDLDKLLEVLIEELNRWQREYYLQYRTFQLCSEVFSGSVSLLNKLQTEPYKLILVDQSWYGFTGKERILQLMVKGPFNASQYKMLSAYVCIGEIAIFQLEGLYDLKNFRDQTRRIYGQLGNVIEVADSVEKLEELSDKLFKRFRI